MSITENMNVDPGSEAFASFVFNSSAKRHAEDAVMEEPEPSRVRLQELIADPKVLDLYNVDASLQNEAWESTQWRTNANDESTENIGTCEKFSPDEAKHVGLNSVYLIGFSVTAAARRKRGLSPRKLSTHVRHCMLVSLQLARVSSLSVCF